MAGYLSTWARDGVLDYLFNQSALTQPSAWYIQCHTADPGLAGTTGVSAYSSRTQCTDWTASSSGALSNNAAVLVAFSGGSETITYITIWDANTSGNCIGIAQLTASKTPADGDSINFAIGEIDVTLT